MSQARTWITKIIDRILFCVQWVQLSYEEIVRFIDIGGIDDHQLSFQIIRHRGNDWATRTSLNVRGTVVVVIVWYLYLQIPMQSVPITTKVESSNPAHDEVYSIQHYVIKFWQWLASCGWFSPCTPVSSANKTYLRDITEILLKVALNTINQPSKHYT